MRGSDKSARLIWVLSVALSSLPSATASGQAPPQSVTGTVKYGPSGVQLDGKTWAWTRLAEVTETPPDPAAMKAEYERRAGRVGKTAGAHATLGKWCRENGLDAEADREVTAALELDPEHAAARKAAGFVKVASGWKKAAEVLPEKLAALKDADRAGRLALADWARDHGLTGAEWDLLVPAAVADGIDAKVGARVKRAVAARRPQTTLRPPLEGRWQFFPDVTRHHQGKVWNIFAIDFVRIDDQGRQNVGRGDSLADYHSWGQPIYAAADGVVVSVKGDYPDAPAGKLGRHEEANTILIRHTAEEYTMYGHLQKGSAAVSAGDKVRKGQLIGKVGNSGTSNVPHLHFALLLAVRDGARSGFVGVPYQFDAFTLVKVGRTPCEVRMKTATPQEGWLMDFDRPTE